MPTDLSADVHFLLCETLSSLWGVGDWHFSGLSWAAPEKVMSVSAAMKTLGFIRKGAEGKSEAIARAAHTLTMLCSSGTSVSENILSWNQFRGGQWG